MLDSLIVYEERLKYTKQIVKKKLLFVDYNISDLPTIIKKPKETHYKTSADNNR